MKAMPATASAVVEQDYFGCCLQSEVSSSFPAKEMMRGEEEEERREEQEHEEEEEEEESELELGLSLGVKKITTTTNNNNNSNGGAPWGEYCRILTAKDFPSMVASRGSPLSSSSSVSSSPSLGGGGRVGVGVVGTKRGVDSVSPPEVGSHTPSQVVGWPPIRAYRMNSLVNQSKAQTSDNNNSIDSGHHKKTTGPIGNIHHKSFQENVTAMELGKKGTLGSTLFVKVNMDGVPIGRKVDLNALHSYETLALSLEDMFQKPSTLTTRTRIAKISKLLDGSSEFVLTYEDRDGDWMLVGDVPWGMFLSTVRRLRIMRTSDTNGLEPRFQSPKVFGLRSNPM